MKPNVGAPRMGLEPWISLSRANRGLPHNSQLFIHTVYWVHYFFLSCMYLFDYVIKDSLMSMLVGFC